ncbi:hypothetical protein WOLCODRAFT_78460 [Wolfiporia cocos MD-104 SS10]|uniref:2OGFeDO JBP1/TET oxygenase domain-containing protein n=1 Tax=Wolfiporia cocos (strain MD-104) TaxID=742152 RepID=A0A2H3JCU9_WOLCO|nr:hypothetical protein WOLCODRAFT_78460 [Wolfiporia cocos MD-104 SS10]
MLGSRPSGTNEMLELQLERKWGPVQQGPPLEISRPCIIMDEHRKILAWCLPFILSERHQVCVHLKFKKTPNDSAEEPSRSTSWRTDRRYFREWSQLELNSGVVNLSPGWHHQGHEGLDDPIYISASLRDKNKQAGDEWLHDIQAILSGMMMVVMHPDLHVAGRECMRQLAQNEELKNTLQRWASIFNGAQIISNWVTPAHHDLKSRMQWYDLLASIGSYHNASLELHGANISIKDGPGTVISLCGTAVRHSLMKYEGDRLCYAYFMRDSVHASMHVEAAGWCKTDHMEALLMLQGL